MRFAHTIGRINSTILLTIFYIFILGTFSLLYKLTRLLAKKNPSGWKKKPSWPSDLDWSYRQF